MRDDLTIIYYTSGREKAGFEAKIQQSLLETVNGLPIISVSQKPIDLGKNICVGEHEASSQNAFRQMQIGAMEAKTKFVCLAESDFLYPKEYFEFIPEREDTGYMVMPVWVLFAQRGKAKVFVLKHRGCEGAMVVGRDCLIGGIERQLHGFGTWGGLHADGSTFPYLFNVINRGYFTIPVPVISFKTDENMHRKTPFKQDSKCRELPYWGNSNEMIRKYCL